MLALAKDCNFYFGSKAEALRAVVKFRNELAPLGARPFSEVEAILGIRPETTFVATDRRAAVFRGGGYSGYPP
jgi:hypothetical protein